MKDFIKISRGFIALFIIAVILLFSDISNRKAYKKNINKKIKIASIIWMDSPATEKTNHGVINGLKDRGLIDGENIELDTYKASGDISMLNSIINQIKTLKPDLLFVSCTPALQCAINNIKDIPIVFNDVADPVLVGAGTSLTNHLKNITGCITGCNFDEMCKLITENAPKIKTLGSLYCPSEIISVKFKDDLTKIAHDYGMLVKFFPANNIGELSDAVLSMCNSKIDAICQIGDNLACTGASTLIKGVVNADLPYFDFNARPLGSKMESLIQLDLDYYQNGYDAAMYAADILLDDKNPNELPFKLPSKQIIELNPVKAKKYGITFNDELINNADIIEGKKALFNPSVNFAIVHFQASPDCDDVEKGILYRFNELGHKKNKDFTFDAYNANADIVTMNNITNVVKNKKYDLIFSTVLPSTQALSTKIKDVPILFTVVADPVGNGLGKSYTTHIKNITGIDCLSYVEESIDLIKKYIPDLSNLGLLFNPGEMASISGLRKLKKSCKKNNIKVTSIPINSITEINDAAILLCSKNIDAVCQIPDSYTISGFSSIIKICQKEKVPLFCFIKSQVEMGAVAGIAGDYFQQGIEIADIAIKIINGESPADIPFCRIKQIQTVINPKATEIYGLKTPEELFKNADYIVKENNK